MSEIDDATEKFSQWRALGNEPAGDEKTLEITTPGVESARAAAYDFREMTATYAARRQTTLDTLEIRLIAIQKQFPDEGSKLYQSADNYLKWIKAIREDAISAQTLPKEFDSSFNNITSEGSFHEAFIVAVWNHLMNEATLLTGKDELLDNKLGNRLNLIINMLLPTKLKGPNVSKANVALSAAKDNIKSLVILSGETFDQQSYADDKLELEQARDKARKYAEELMGFLKYIRTGDAAFRDDGDGGYIGYIENKFAPPHGLSPFRMAFTRIWARHFGSLQEKMYRGNNNDLT